MTSYELTSTISFISYWRLSFRWRKLCLLVSQDHIVTYWKKTTANKLSDISTLKTLLEKGQVDNVTLFNLIKIIFL